MLKLLPHSWKWWRDQRKGRLNSSWKTQPIHLGAADESQEVKIGTTSALKKLIYLLKEYKDALAWSYMIRLDSAQEKKKSMSILVAK